MDIKEFPQELKKYAYGAKTTIYYDVEKYDAGGGRIKTLCTRKTPRTRWEIKINHMTDEENSILVSFFMSLKGGFEPFLWEVDGKKELVRFVGDKLGVDRVFINFNRTKSIALESVVNAV